MPPSKLHCVIAVRANGRRNPLAFIVDGEAAERCRQNDSSGSPSRKIRIESETTGKSEREGD